MSLQYGQLQLNNETTPEVPIFESIVNMRVKGTKDAPVLSLTFSDGTQKDFSPVSNIIEKTTQFPDGALQVDTLFQDAITVIGAEIGDNVDIFTSNAINNVLSGLGGYIIKDAWVSAPDEVSYSFFSNIATETDDPTYTFTVRIIKQLNH